MSTRVEILAVIEPSTPTMQGGNDIRLGGTFDVSGKLLQNKVQGICRILRKVRHKIKKKSVGSRGPRLWSSDQSSWLQIQSYGLDSRRCLCLLQIV
jgi:hypothetical protein